VYITQNINKNNKYKMKNVIVSFTMLNILIFSICHTANNFQLKCEFGQLIFAVDGFNNVKDDFPNTLTVIDQYAKLKTKLIDLEGGVSISDNVYLSFFSDGVNYAFSFALEDWKNLNEGIISTIKNGLYIVEYFDEREGEVKTGAQATTSCTKI
jgi:hypothetical protein